MSFCWNRSQSLKKHQRLAASFWFLPKLHYENRIFIPFATCTARRTKTAASPKKPGRAAEFYIFYSILIFDLFLTLPCKRSGISVHFRFSRQRSRIGVFVIFSRITFGIFLWMTIHTDKTLNMLISLRTPDIFWIHLWN